ncbi:MAG: serine hydrolase domain-containing protein, partial [Candidatus Promineifilaceae bacterium]
ALMVIDADGVVYERCLGMANLEHGIPLRPNTVFKLASITKQFTATAIMMLQEQGKLSINDSLLDHMPDYPTGGRDIRIHHLLTHTSGIKSYTSLEGWFPNKMMQDKTPAEMRDRFSGEPFDFEPGERYLYNNSGYFLLGMIIEQLSGMPYADFIREHIFAPLGMNGSVYMENRPIIPNRASGYDRTANGYHHAQYISMAQPFAAGALGSTLEDLQRWDSALRQHTLVSEATLAQMWTPAMLNDGTVASDGYGWAINAYRGRRLINHAGGIPGFSTYMMHLPEDGVSLYLLANFSNFFVPRLMHALLPIILGLPSIERNPIFLSEAAQTAIVGSYRLTNGMIVKVVVENGILMLDSFNKAQLLPLSDTLFSLKGEVEVEISFDSGNLTYASPLVSFTGSRIEQTDV